MNTKKKFFIVSMPIIMAIFSLFMVCNYADAASRTAVRNSPASRKAISVQRTSAQKQDVVQQTTEPEPTENTESEFIEPEPVIEESIIENKSDKFEQIVSAVMESATEDNSFAEQIRRQRAALAASESANAVQASNRSGRNTCDSGLRECMMETCGKDFTKCATDGDTMFGEKLNRCRLKTECTGEEFQLFTTEIKADRDTNVKMASYNAVIDCGNSYNACIMNECGTTYSKCLGKSAADVAIEKCAKIAQGCREQDSGLASRFGTVVATLRENAEIEVKKDEKRMYELRDLMAKQCTGLGAMFDERTFDCVYTVNFFAGNNQKIPTASRKRYAGDTFVCMQEWFGINTTTYKENAYRETRAQTGASSAMLGSGVGTAVGLITSGAINRALETQQAKKALDAAQQEATENQNKPATATDNGGSDNSAQSNEETSSLQVEPFGENTQQPGGFGSGQMSQGFTQKGAATGGFSNPTLGSATPTTNNEGGGTTSSTNSDSTTASAVSTNTSSETSSTTTTNTISNLNTTTITESAPKTDNKKSTATTKKTTNTAAKKTSSTQSTTSVAKSTAQNTPTSVATNVQNTNNTTSPNLSFNTRKQQTFSFNEKNIQQMTLDTKKPGLAIENGTASLLGVRSNDNKSQSSNQNTGGCETRNGTKIPFGKALQVSNALECLNHGATQTETDASKVYSWEIVCRDNGDLVCKPHKCRGNKWTLNAKTGKCE